MKPLAKAAPHPYIKGAWTVRDPRAGMYIPMLASKVTAEIIVNKRNEDRRQK